MLVNKDVTGFGLEELEDVLGTLISPVEYQSNKQPISLRWTREKKPRMEWKSDLGHGRWDELRRLEGFLAKRVGRPFAEVYKEFLNRFDPNLIVGWGSMRERFMDMFVSTRLGGVRDDMSIQRPFYRCRGNYYIDDDLNIQEVKRTPIYKRRASKHSTTEEKPKKPTKAELNAIGAMYDEVLKSAKQAAKRKEVEARLDALYGKIFGRPL